MTYCTSEDVAKYATLNVSTDVDSVLTAIDIAKDLINRYTNDIFEPTVLTVEASTNNAGVASLPYTVQDVTSVELSETGTVLTDNQYFFTGGRNASVKIKTNAPWNILIVGLEPWTNRSMLRASLTVTGVFGHATTPAGVKEATAILAGILLAETGQGVLTAAGETAQGVQANIQSMSVEGFSVSYATTDKPTTGATAVDRLLTPYMRNTRSRWS